MNFERSTIGTSPRGTFIAYSDNPGVFPLLRILTNMLYINDKVLDFLNPAIASHCYIHRYWLYWRICFIDILVNLWCLVNLLSFRIKNNVLLFSNFSQLYV